MKIKKICFKIVKQILPKKKTINAIKYHIRFKKNKKMI